MIDRLVELINLSNAGFLTRDYTEGNARYCLKIKAYMPSGEVLDLFIYDYVSDGIFIRFEDFEGVRSTGFIDVSSAYKLLAVYKKGRQTYERKYYLWEMLECSFVGEDCEELRNALDEFEEGQSCKVS